MADKARVEARQEHYREAHNSLDAERFSALFADHAEYADHGLGVAGPNKEALMEPAKGVFGSCSELVLTTVSVHGDREFAVWEWTAAAVLSKEIPGLAVEVGEEVKSVGCSLFWRVGAAEDVEGWKIRKDVEYSKFL